MHCSIHTNIHPMLGLDLHMGSPAPITPPVLMPHITAQVLGGIVGSAKLVPTVLSHNFITLNQGSDIGMGIGHIPLGPNWLFWLYPLTSGSVSHFGSFSVLSGNKPTAAAIIPIPIIGLGINMNCSSPCNLPGGRVIAPGCNMVGLGMADVFAGTISMALDAAVSFAAGKIGGKFINGAWSRIVGLIPSRMLVTPAVINIIRASNRAVSFDGIGEILGGALGKSPVGGYIGDVTGAAVEFYQEEFIGDFSNGTLINP